EAQLADALHAVKTLEDALQYERVRVLRANHRLRQYRTGVEAIVLAPVRFVRSIVRRLTRRHRLDLVPLFQLNEQGAGLWQTLGSDPQFLLLADINWPRLHGWYWL